MRLELSSWKCQATVFCAECRLVCTLLFQVTLKVLSCDSLLTLRVVDAFHNSFRTVVIHVIEIVSPRKLFVALLTLEQNKLALLLEVVSHLDLQYVLQAELTYLKSVRALLAMFWHRFPYYPRLAS